MNSGSRRGPGRLLSLAVLLLAAFGISLLQRCSRAPRMPSDRQRGEPRELSFVQLDGSTWRLSEHRGQVVAVNLWATWCGPCRAETPMVERVAGDLGQAGFRVVGVSLDTGGDREARVRSFRDAFHLTYPLAFPGAMSQIESGLDGLPTTLLFDRRGRAARVYVGQLRERTLRADVGALLMEPAAARNER